MEEAGNRGTSQEATALVPARDGEAWTKSVIILMCDIHGGVPREEGERQAAI